MQPAPAPSPSCPRPGRAFRTPVRIALVLLALGLLLWAKLIVVTGYPRTAIARPGSAAAAKAGPASHPAR